MAVNFAKLPGLLRKQYADGSVLRAVPQSDVTGNFRDNGAAMLSLGRLSVGGHCTARRWLRRAQVSCYVSRRSTVPLGNISFNEPAYEHP